MAHHRFDVLEELVKDIDDERNDIFLHIDKKTKKFDENEFKDRQDVIDMPHYPDYGSIKVINDTIVIKF